MKASLPILTLVVGAIIGWGGHNLVADGTDDRIDSQDSEQMVGMTQAEHMEIVGRLKKTIAALKGDAQESRSAARVAKTENSALLAELKKVKGENAEMTARVDAGDLKKKERMAAIEDRFKKLRGKGIGALISNNEIGKLVADLLQEGPQGQAAVLALLASEDGDEQMLGVVLMLQGMASVESIDPLTKMALENGDETMKAMASQVLMRMDDKEAGAALEKLVAETKDEGVKVNSLFGLARQGNKNGVQQLLDYYNDENSKHADVLTQSFFVLTNPESQPLIDAAVARFADNGNDSERARINAAAVKYYGHVKTPASRRALENLANDPNVSVRVKEKARAAMMGW